MTVQQITAFKTSDQTLFETQVEADKHEIELFIARTLTTIAVRMYHFNMTEDDLITHLNSESSALRELFKQVQQSEKTLLGM